MIGLVEAESERMMMMRRIISERATCVSKNFVLRSSASRFHGESLDSSVSPVLIPGVHVFHCQVSKSLFLFCSSSISNSNPIGWLQDAVGIVAKLSDCIAAKGGNILGYDVFVPENNNVFYSRR